MQVLLLAADRGRADPLAVGAGVAGKALTPIAGRPMAAHVLDRVFELRGIERVIMVCPDLADYRALAGGRPEGSVQLMAPAASPASSVARALAAFDPAVPVAVVTADHPLLQPAWIEQVVGALVESGADAAMGLTDWARVAERFPGGQRTRYRFSDLRICGTNVFALRMPGGVAIAEAWQRVEADRKRPWRILRILGPGNVVRYLAGRLTLAGAFAALSRRTGLKIVPVLIEAPESALDVDSLEDLERVRTILCSPSGSGGR